MTVEQPLIPPSDFRVSRFPNSRIFRRGHFGVWRWTFSVQRSVGSPDTASFSFPAFPPFPDFPIFYFSAPMHLQPNRDYISNDDVQTPPELAAGRGAFPAGRPAPRAVCGPWPFPRALRAHARLAARGPRPTTVAWTEIKRGRDFFAWRETGRLGRHESAVESVPRVPAACDGRVRSRRVSRHDQPPLDARADRRHPRGGFRRARDCVAPDPASFRRSAFSSARFTWLAVGREGSG